MFFHPLYVDLNCWSSAAVLANYFNASLLFFPVVRHKPLVLQVKLITSCPSYHGEDQKFLPTSMSVYFCIDFTVFAFIGASSLWTVVRQIQDWQEWVMHKYVIVGLSLRLCQDTIQHSYLFQLLPKKGACRNVLQMFRYTTLKLKWYVTKTHPWKPN